MADGQPQVKLYGSVRADATYDFKGSNGSISNGAIIHSIKMIQNKTHSMYLQQLHVLA